MSWAISQHTYRNATARYGFADNTPCLGAPGGLSARAAETTGSWLPVAPENPHLGVFFL